jgi:hypothetical protein
MPPRTVDKHDAPLRGRERQKAHEIKRRTPEGARLSCVLLALLSRLES